MIADRHQTDELPNINMTPMVDIVLCLLVFFMAATKLYDWDEAEFSVRVPEVAAAAPGLEALIARCLRKDPRERWSGADEMSRALRAVAIAAATALLLPGSALARECGIPDSNPLWVDYAGHDAPVPQKPGLTLAYSSGTEKPSAARAAGAAPASALAGVGPRILGLGASGEIESGVGHLGTPCSKKDPCGARASAGVGRLLRTLAQRLPKLRVPTRAGFRPRG